MSIIAILTDIKCKNDAHILRSSSSRTCLNIANSGSAWHGRADGQAVPEFHVIQVLLCKHAVGRVGFRSQSGRALLAFNLIYLCRYVIQNRLGFAHVIFIVQHTVVGVPPAFPPSRSISLVWWCGRIPWELAQHDDDAVQQQAKWWWSQAKAGRQRP